MPLRIAVSRRQSQARRALAVCASLALLSAAPAAGRQTAGSDGSRPQNSTDAWLNISLAEYEAWREMRAKQPEDAERRVARARAWVQQDRSSRPLAAVPGTAAEAAAAQKRLVERGFLVWRTLETVISRERVDRAVQELRRRHAGGATVIADFQRICEEISGRALDWFFAYYLRSTELPMITLRRTAGNAPNEITGEIVVSNAPAEFQVRVEMRLMTSTGAIAHSVATSGAVTPFTVVSREPVTHILLDPDARILRKTPGVALD